MCLQCLTDSYDICEIFSGWLLARAQKSYEDKESKSWLKGQLALIRMNDPDIIFSVEPIKDPAFYLNETEAEKYYDENELGMDKFDEISHLVYTINNEMKCNPIVGYKLVSAAITNGYDFKQMNFEFWLMQKMAEAVERYDKKER